MSKYNIVYKITNELNGKIYIGCHQTENVDDNYMGSGIALHKAFKKYGIENFTKEILFKLDSFDAMFEKEAELVNKDFVKNKNTYNLQLGGKGFNTKGLISVQNKDKTHGMLMDKNDPRYNIEYFPLSTGQVVVKDKMGNSFKVLKDDPRYLSGELEYINKDKNNFVDKDGNIFFINKNDPRILSGELISFSKNKLIVKDKNEKCFQVSKNDPRYLSGELVPIWTGKSLSKEHKEKISKANKISQSGKLNSQYGTCWINKDGIAKKIKKEELDSCIELGWNKGRKINES